MRRELGKGNWGRELGEGNWRQGTGRRELAPGNWRQGTGVMELETGRSEETGAGSWKGWREKEGDMAASSVFSCWTHPSEVCLRIAGVEQVYQVKRTVKGIGGVLSSAYSKTLNR